MIKQENEELRIHFLSQFGNILYTLAVLFPIFGQIVPDHDCTNETISFNLSSTGIPENHKNRLLPRSSAEPAWESLATEFLLVCENSIKGKDLLFYGLVGEFCCILINGWICDTFGRKRAILISNIIYASATAIHIFAKSYWIFSVCRFLIHYSAASILLTTPLYGKEIAKFWPSTPFILWSVFSYASVSFGSIFAFYFPDWKELLLLNLLCSLVYFVCLFFIPESHVFLDAQKNKFKEGKVAKFDVAPNRQYFMVLVIFSFCQITSNFVYYGLLWNAGSLSGSVHVNSAINGVMATVGSLLQIPLHKKLSTKKITSCSFLLVAASILVALCFPTSVVISSCYFFGLLMIVLTYLASFDMADIFPVNCRSISSGICFIIGRCGSLTLPYFPLLSVKHQLSILFLLPAIAGSIYSLLPTISGKDHFGNKIIYEKVSETNAALKEKTIFKKKSFKSGEENIYKNEHFALVS